MMQPVGSHFLSFSAEPLKLQLKLKPAAELSPSETETQFTASSGADIKTGTKIRSTSKQNEPILQLLEA